MFTFSTGDFRLNSWQSGWGWVPGGFWSLWCVGKKEKWGTELLVLLCEHLCLLQIDTGSLQQTLGFKDPEWGQARCCKAHWQDNCSCKRYVSSLPFLWFPYSQPRRRCPWTKVLGSSIGLDMNTCFDKAIKMPFMCKTVYSRTWRNTELYKTRMISTHMAKNLNILNICVLH